jgi:hypothetical protein
VASKRQEARPATWNGTYGGYASHRARQGQLSCSCSSTSRRDHAPPASFSDRRPSPPTGVEPEAPARSIAHKDHPGKAMSPAELRELVSVREEQRQMVLEDRLAREIERTAYFKEQERRAPSGAAPQVAAQVGDVAGQLAAPQGQRGRRKLRVCRDDNQRPIRRNRSPLAQLSTNMGAQHRDTTIWHARLPQEGSAAAPPPERWSRASLGYMIFDDTADQAAPAQRPRLREGLRISMHPNRSPEFAYTGSVR